MRGLTDAYFITARQQQPLYSTQLSAVNCSRLAFGKEDYNSDCNS
jgi:hypothetical protein